MLRFVGHYILCIGIGIAKAVLRVEKLITISE